MQSMVDWAFLHLAIVTILHWSLPVWSSLHSFVASLIQFGCMALMHDQSKDIELSSACNLILS